MSSNNADRRPLAKRSEAVTLLAVLTGMALFCILFARQIESFAGRLFMPCLLLEFTGIRCPLCGGTRCVRALLRMDFAAAVYYNPMVILGIIAGLYYYVRLAVSCLAKKYVPYRIRLGEKIWWVILAVCTFFFIARNTPLYQTCFY